MAFSDSELAQLRRIGKTDTARAVINALAAQVEIHDRVGDRELTRDEKRSINHFGKVMSENLAKLPGPATPGLL